MKVTINLKEVLLIAETLQDGFEIGRTVNYFDSQNIIYSFQREFMTLLFNIPLKERFEEKE